jgi:DNA-directed RNA polymerase specialized sigma24 family protein
MLTQRSSPGQGGSLDLSVSVLRELFRNYALFRAVYEDNGVDTVTHGSIEVTIWDMDRLYELLPRLPVRQRQAIELCLVQQYREREAALLMGVSETNPVAMYATSGLANLLAIVAREGLRGSGSRG